MWARRTRRNRSGTKNIPNSYAKLSEPYRRENSPWKTFISFVIVVTWTSTFFCLLILFASTVYITVIQPDAAIQAANLMNDPISALAIVLVAGGVGLETLADQLAPKWLKSQETIVGWIEKIGAMLVFVGLLGEMAHYSAALLISATELVGKGTVSLVRPLGVIIPNDLTTYSPLAKVIIVISHIYFLTLVAGIFVFVAWRHYEDNVSDAEAHIIEKLCSWHQNTVAPKTNWKANDPIVFTIDEIDEFLESPGAVDAKSKNLIKEEVMIVVRKSKILREPL